MIPHPRAGTGPSRTGAPPPRAGTARPRGALDLLVFAAVGFVALTAVVATQSRWLTPDDLTFTRAVHASALSHPAVGALAVAVSTGGGPTVVDAAVLVLALGALVRRRRRVALALVVARVGSQLTSSLVKEVVDRPRPPVLHPLDEVTDPSFPSGHTTAAASLVVLLALLLRRGGSSPALRRGAAVALVAVALVVGVSRLAVGVHYPSDVIAGLLAGAAWAAAASLLGASGWADPPAGADPSGPGRARTGAGPVTRA